MIRITYIIAISLFIYSCKNDMVKEEFYANGALKSKYTLINDTVPHGPFVSYYKTGEVESEGAFKNGYAADTLYRFFKDGKLKEKGILQGDLKKGWWKYFREQGGLKSREEFIIMRDSMYKNQDILYLENGEIDLENSTFYEITIPDTITLGKNLGKIDRYVSNYRFKDKYLWVVVDNEYEKGLIKKDTFSDGTFTPDFGIFARKRGMQSVKGTIVEQILVDNPIDSTLTITEHHKYFSKEVYVKDSLIH